MASEKKINAIADAEYAGLYYSSNTEPGYTRKVNEKEQSFFDVSGKPLKSKREIKRIDELRIPPHHNLRLTIILTEMYLK